MYRRPQTRACHESPLGQKPGGQQAPADYSTTQQHNNSTTTEPKRMVRVPTSPSSHIDIQLDIEWTFHMRIGHVVVLQVPLSSRSFCHCDTYRPAGCGGPRRVRR